MRIVSKNIWISSIDNDRFLETRSKLKTVPICSEVLMYIHDVNILWNSLLIVAIICRKFIHIDTFIYVLPYNINVLH